MPVLINAVGDQKYKVQFIVGFVEKVEQAAILKTFHIEGSDLAKETGFAVTDIGLLPQRLNQLADLTDMSASELTSKEFTHLEYGGVVKIPKASQDDNPSLCGKYPLLLANRAAKTIKYVASVPWQNAFVGGVHAMHDGQPLCSAAHVLKSGGTFGNLGNSTLGHTALMIRQGKMLSTLTESGLKEELEANKLIVHTANKKPAEQLLASPYTDSNYQVNVNKGLELIADNNLCADEDDYFLQAAEHSMWMFIREEPSIEYEWIPIRRMHEFTAALRASCGPIHWFGIDGTDAP